MHIFALTCSKTRIQAQAATKLKVVVSRVKPVRVASTPTWYKRETLI
jgi:hypothetical protein